jgi:phage gp36-like protein
MPYSTLDDIKKLLPEETIIQLTDDENLKPLSIDPENAEHAAIIGRIDEAIETADSEIDGYCAKKYKYAVPFTAVPRLITGLSVEIAIYYLYARRTVPERIEKRYEKAVARLKDISRGLLTLTLDPPPAPSSAGGAESNKPVNDRIFTRETLRGF